MVRLQGEFDFVDPQAVAGERSSGALYDGRDARIDGKIAETRTIGDLQPADRPTDACAIVDAIIGQRKWIARMRAGHDLSHQRGVSDGAGERPNMHKGMAPQERIRPRDGGN